MFEKLLFRSIVALTAVMLLIGTAGAVEIETVPVGNLGNTGELSGGGAGGYGPDRICGAVDYAYNIGTYEVTAGQYTEFLNAVADNDSYGLYNPNMWSSTYGCKIQQSGSSPNYSYSVAADYANRPVNYVSWGDAARFANWLHNDQPTGILTGNPALDAGLTEDGAYDLNGAVDDAGLLAVSRESDWRWAITSEDEWYKAAYHKNDGDTANYFDYPTQSDDPNVPGRDMAEATNPGNNANYYGTPFPIDSPYYTTLAGEFELSDSPYGTFDQGGNVWEWNEAILSGSYRGLRGGSFLSYGHGLLASYRYDPTPTYEINDVGFRVASIPEPGSITLLVCGTVAGLMWWRRRK